MARMMPSGPIMAEPSALNTPTALVKPPDAWNSARPVLMLLTQSLTVETVFMALVTVLTAGPTARRPTAKAMTVPLCSHRKSRKGFALS